MTLWTRLSLCALAVAIAAPPPLPAQQPVPPAAPIVEALPGMGRAIDTAVTRGRRDRLLARLGDAVVLVPAAHERATGEYAQDNDFRQHNVFFYFSMLEAPDAWILLNGTAAGAAEAALFLPPRNPARERWTGPKLGPGEDAVRLTGFATVLSTHQLDSALDAALARGVPVYAPLDATTRGDAVLARLRADTARVVLRNLRPVVDSMRVIKDALEIATLRRAALISANAHVAMMRAARENQFEYELEAVVEGAFRRQGADRVGYPSIVGCGINGTVLHYDANRRQCRPGELVVVDAAAEWGQYTADVTRTFPVSGTFTPRQRALYALVLGAQQAAMDSTRPGTTVQRLNQIAREYLREHSSGLCGERTCDAFFIHSLSHGLGMDVHDPGRIGPLQPGMVFTIEPGVYLPDEGVGVRIEDDILVTATGYENLSAAAPRSADDIERLMRAGRSAGPGSTR